MLPAATMTVGVILLIVGLIKPGKHRGWLIALGSVLFLAGALPGFVQGLRRGIETGRELRPR